MLCQLKLVNGVNGREGFPDRFYLKTVKFAMPRSRLKLRVNGPMLMTAPLPASRKFLHKVLYALKYLTLSFRTKNLEETS